MIQTFADILNKIEKTKIIGMTIKEFGLFLSVISVISSFITFLMYYGNETLFPLFTIVLFSFFTLSSICLILGNIIDMKEPDRYLFLIGVVLIFVGIFLYIFAVLGTASIVYGFLLYLGIILFLSSKKTKNKSMVLMSLIGVFIFINIHLLLSYQIIDMLYTAPLWIIAILFILLPINKIKYNEKDLFSIVSFSYFSIYIVPFHEMAMIHSNSTYGFYDLFLLLSAIGLFAFYSSIYILNNRIDSMLRKGYAYIKENDYEKALDIFDEVLIRKRDVMALNGKAIVHMKNKRIDKAIDLLQSAMKIEDNFDVKLNLANAYVRGGNVTEGIEIYKKMMGTYGQKEELLNNLGVAYLKIGEKEKGNQLLKKKRT
jgi:hypothetical protein